MEVRIKNWTIIADARTGSERVFHLTRSEAVQLRDALDSAVEFLGDHLFTPVTFGTSDVTGQIR